jgi:hypothetical protein
MRSGNIPRVVGESFIGGFWGLEILTKSLWDKIRELGKTREQIK